MDRPELTKEVHEQLKKANLSSNYKQSKEIVDIVFDTLVSNIAVGKTIKIAMLGKFQSKQKEFNDISNPGHKVTRWWLNFSCAETLKRKLNG